MIEIICDQFRLCPALKDDVVIQEGSDYENALNRIIAAAQQTIPLRFIIINPALFDWFDAPAKKYGCIIKRIDPVGELKKAIQRPIVPEVIRNRPELIIELNLLEKSHEKPIDRQESPDNWFKRILLGDVWRKHKIETQEDMAELINWLLSNHAAAFHPFLYTIMDGQFTHWQQNTPNKSDILKWLQKEPFQRSWFIAWEQVLNTYPPNRVSEWLQNDGIWFALSQLGVRDRIPKLNCEGRLPHSIENYLRVFLEETWQQSPENALAYISGQLEIEKLFLTDALKKRLNDGNSINQEFFNRISNFTNFPEVKELAIQLLPTKAPAFPEIHFSVADIQNWLGAEYLPFYNSCSLLNRVELTEPYIESFEKWLKNNYISMLINGNGMAYRQLASLKKKVNQQPILVVLFDGLDFFNAKNQLVPALKENGLFPITEVTPYLSFLPSETFIAKPTIVSGKMKSQIADEIPDSTFYRDLIQHSFQLSSEKVRAATDKEMGLKELVQEPAAVYLYLDNQLDREYLHAVFKPYLRQKKYSEYLKKQAVAIAEAANLIEELHNVGPQIIVCSDHGHTTLPSTAEIIHLNISEKVKARSVYTSSVAKNNFTTESSWVMQPDLFGLNEEMAVPLGYRCFSKRPKGATHGGATPQEIAVPWIVFSLNKPEPMQPISFIIEGEIHRRRGENDINIMISNPNNYSVTLLDFHLNRLDFKAELPMELSQKEIKKIKASFDASEVGENSVEIAGRYLARTHIEEIEFDFTLTVQTTGAMTTEFDDEFEL